MNFHDNPPQFVMRHFVNQTSTFIATVVVLGMFAANSASANIPSARTFYNVSLSVKIYEDKTSGLQSGLSLLGPLPSYNFLASFNHNATLVVAPTITDSGTPNGSNAREFGLYTGDYQSMPGFVNASDGGLLRFSTNQRLAQDLGVKSLPTATGQGPAGTLTNDVAFVKVNEPTNTVTIDVDPNRGFNYANSFTRNQSIYSTHLGANAIASGTTTIKFSPDGSQVQGQLRFESGSSYSGSLIYEATFQGSTSSTTPPGPQQGLDGTIWGQVYNDLDNNASKGTDDPPLANRRIYVDANNNSSFDSGEKNCLTNEAGFYLIYGLASGFYRVRLETLSGWQATTTSLIVSVTSGQISGGNNFGSRRPGLSVSGKVSVDLNGDGLRDSDLDGDGVQDWDEDKQGGLPGWTVFADADGDRVLDASEARAESDVQGKFYIYLGNITSGEYAICLVNKPGWVVNFPMSGNQAGVFGPLGLTPEDIDLGPIYFRAYQPITISGTTFNDLNADSENDPGEPGLANWRVYLDADNDQKYDVGETNVLTAADGTYAFSNIKPGLYYVRQVQKSGWLRSFPSVLVPGFGDSKGGWGVRAHSGYHARPADFGNHQRGTILFTAFHDKDGNGTKAADEEYLPARTVFIDSDNDGVLDSSTFTKASTDIPKTVPDMGTATSSLTVSERSGVLRDVNVTLNITHAVAHDLDITLIAPSGKRILLAARPTGPNGNFTGTIFDDEATTKIADGNAPFSGSFQPLKALSSLDRINPNGVWKLEIIDNQQDHSGVLNSWSLTIKHGEASAQTDASGAWYFPGLAPGEYTVRQIVPTGWVETAPLAGFLKTTLAASAVELLNFGTARSGSIAGTVWKDINGDLYQQSNEPGLANWRVYVDTDSDGIFDTGEKSALTNANGAYLITQLKPGKHLVRQVLQTAWRQSYPWLNAGHDVTLKSGQGITFVDFGATKTGAISGNVFNDLEANGVKNPTDTPLVFWPIYLDANNNGNYDSTLRTLSSADTPRLLANPGNSVSTISVSGITDYLLDIQVKLNIQHAFDSDLRVFLVAPSGRMTRLFANIGGSGDNFTNTVFDNVASTSIRAGVPPFAGTFRPEEQLYLAGGESLNGTWSLVIEDVNPYNQGVLQNWSLIVRTSNEPYVWTDDNGDYSFYGLSPGTYNVRQFAQPDWRRTFPATNAYTATIGTATDARNCNFGNVRIVAPVNESLSPSSGAAVGGRVFTAKYADENGASDITAAHFLVNTSTNTANALYVYYNAANNKLYLRNDAGTAFIGGFVPGSNNTISNSQGSLNCANTTVSKSGDTLTLNWSLVPAAKWAGTTQNIYLYVRDVGGLTDGFDLMGAWSISSSAGAAKTTTTGAASPIQLSSAAAWVKSHSLQLTFSGALNSTAAEEVGHYQVTVNGQILEVLRADYNAATASVILSLPTGTFKVGDTLTVVWSNLRDSKSAMLNGDTSALIAR